MAATIITKEDLIEFKQELFNELRDLIAPTTKPTTEAGKQWLKTWEVQKMLGLSPGTLQAMRTNGTIAYTRIGGLIFYSYEDILKLMKPQSTSRSLRTNNPRRPR